jgi:hypothetical protein
MSTHGASLSSSSSPCRRLAAETRSASMDSQDYRHSPLKPAPLRLPSKSGAGTPRTDGEPLSTVMKEAEPATPPSHMSSQIDGQHWSAIKERRSTAPKLAGLVSKFEILDAMSVVGGRPPAPPIPLRNPSRLGITPSPLGPHQLKQARSMMDITLDESAQKVAWRATIEGPLIGKSQVQLSSSQAVALLLAQEDQPEPSLLRQERSTSFPRSAVNDPGAGVSATD